MKAKRASIAMLAVTCVVLLIVLLVLSVSALMTFMFGHPGFMDSRTKERCTWRSCSSEYTLESGLTITLSYRELMTDDGPCHSFAVYESTGGFYMGTLLLSAEDTKKLASPWEADILIEDRDSDGLKDIGIVLDEGSILWYSLQEISGKFFLPMATSS